MEKDKRIYSINLVAYIMLATSLKPSYHWDTKTHTVYCVFPECQGVTIAIWKYKAQNPQIKLHNFLACIKEVRENIKRVEAMNLEKN